MEKRFVSLTNIIQKKLYRVRYVVLFISFLLFLFFSFSNLGYAREGDCGYEGGISSGEVLGKTVYDYQEYFFATGEPVLMKGTLTIKKSGKPTQMVTVYTYALKNIAKNATLTRAVTLTTNISIKENGQKIEDTIISKPTESVKIGTQAFTLKTYDFTRSNLIDPWPTVNYFAGNFNGKKTYSSSVGTGTTSSAGIVTVENSGEYYGYDEYWGSAEMITSKVIVSGEQRNGSSTDKWGGTAEITLSQSSAKQISYIENKPGSISFNGGYIQSQYNNSVLEISSSFPEFDTKGISTDRIINFSDTLKLESFPVQTRLPVMNLKQIRGHWSEKDATELFSLEVFKGKSNEWKPDAFMKRDEFASVIVAAAKEVPPDPAIKITSSATKTTTTKPSSSFVDVLAVNPYLNQVEAAYKRGLMVGKTSARFDPNGVLTVAEALTVFVHALGLENLAPNPVPMTGFQDDSKIPEFARASVYVAEKIGIAKADEKGYLKPNDKLTKGRAAVLVNSFINYMRTGLRADYRERALGY